jgi:hypothetical protein
MFADMRADQFIDAVQTAALIVTAGAQLYTMLLLRNEMRSAARALNGVIQSLARMGTRVSAIEDKLDIHRPSDASSV